MSFSKKERMSGMAWRICANRSMPNPKAKPDHRPASMPFARP